MGLDKTFPSGNQILTQTVALGVAGGSLLWGNRKRVVGRLTPKAKAHARRLSFAKLLEDAAAQPDTAGSDSHLMLRTRDAILRVGRIVASMKGRAEDNPQGIKAETLAMFAEELELALEP